MAKYSNGGHKRLGRGPTPITIVGGIVAATIAIIIIAAAGCGIQGSDRTTPAGPSPTPGTVAVTTPTAASKAPATVSAVPPLLVTVPNVVGKDLQTAQEELFPPLRSTSIDATGQGRLQIIDSNWIVVRQEPAAGKTVLALTDIKLFVVKKGESAR